MPQRREIKFGTDGWRGVVADDFTFQNVAYAGQGIAEYLKARAAEPMAVVGYDCRFVSEDFARTIARTFAANGVRSLIFDRPSPTQVASWTVIDRKAQGAAVITASHNPAAYNGVKYKPETGSSAPTEVIAELERLINAAADADRVQTIDGDAAKGLIETYDPRPAYYRQLAKMLDLDAVRGAGLKILHECMYGSAYSYVTDLLDGGTTEVTELHAERNPYFGGFPPEPIPPNLDSALATMRSGGYDLCIATDGDADRVGIIDETGRFITQLQVYALLMLYLFEQRGLRGPVVKTINMTSMADKLAEQYGVPVYELPVGFKNVAPKMMETDAVLGGEESGGFGFRGHIPERDGILAGLFFADMIVRTGKPVSAILAELESRVGPHAYARHDIHLPRDSYEQDRRRILETLREKQPHTVAGVEVERVRDDDGFKFFLKDGSW
ncbi:MAG TPA: phosphoglucomutase/phosphomannomutase family protein, partial [Solirubrobacterales bacterium]|nr:phosphoglucomutase/phosphomannomutase family protein [Solirubrobacterales bacterium]